MNTLFQKITPGLVLALSLSLTSCEKDSLLTPEPVGSARSGAVNDVIEAGIPQVHKLAHYGDATLTYADNGRLLQVTTPIRGGLSIQTDYTYSPGKIRAFSHQGKIVLRDETFTLNGSGRCTESAEEITVINNNTPSHYVREWKFTYNAKGQLSSCQNKNSCVGGFLYDYNADGDMSRATESTGVSSSIETTFSYSQPGSGPMLSDNYPLNVIGVNEHDAYLRIFGKPSKHLVTLATRQGSLDGDYYAYLLDADGYVTQRKQYQLIGAALVDTKSYAYVLTNIGFSF
ncbi:hypothetical protein [Spirosoma jeollabukense]